MNKREQIEHNSLLIYLTQGKVTMLDAEDLPLIERYTWHAVTNDKGLTFYAASTITTATGWQNILMHRLILDAPPGIQVDHKDGDGLNNRRNNMRLATVAQNQANRRSIQSNNTSGYRGVSKERDGWRASIRFHGTLHYLGKFGTRDEAYRVYKHKASELFGEFARV